MRKLHLDPDALCVDTFATERADAPAGTVHAHATPVTACPVSQCYSCDPLCEMTSFGSCPETNCCEHVTDVCQPLTAAEGCEG